MATEAGRWSVSESGCLTVDDEVESVIYHPTLNVLLVTSKACVLHVIDVTSGDIFHSADLSGSSSLMSVLSGSNWTGMHSSICRLEQCPVHF